MIFVVAFLFAQLTYGKIYDRCELARELKLVHKAPIHQLAVWVCIAEHESQYNTSIVGHLSGDGSGDHGIFQINDKFWCSPPGKGYACGLTCAELEDDNISDDFICAQKIYKEHKQLSGDGFNAWAVYQPHCKGSKAHRYTKDCFVDSEEPKTFTTLPSAFAHGFFDTVAGKANKEFSTIAKKPVFETLLNFKSPAIDNTRFTFATEKPEHRSFSAPKLSLFVNRYFPSTENPSSNILSNPTAGPTSKSTISTTTFIPTTPKPGITNFAIFNPTRSTPSVTVPTLGRSAAFESGKTFLTSFGNIIFTSTASTPAPLSSTVSQISTAKPIFIINGVKWY